MRHTRLYRQGMLEAKDFPAAQISDFLQQPGTVVWLDLCEPDQEDLAVVDQTVQPTRVSLWLQPSSHGSSGTPHREARPTTWAY